MENLISTRQRSQSMAAFVSSKILQIRKESIKQSLSDLNTVGHRQSYVATIDGVMYYDDSKAESVNATWFTFESIINPVVWIAGGHDTHADFAELKPAVRRTVRALICIGKDEKLKSTFARDIKEFYQADSIEEAVGIASVIAKKEDIVLFSPACRTGRGAESNEERGNRYIESVKNMEQWATEEKY